MGKRRAIGGNTQAEVGRAAFLSALLHEPRGARIAVNLSSLKLGVFKDIRRLISIEAPFAGRISFKNWNHSVNVTISA